MTNKQDFQASQQFKDYIIALALGLVPGSVPEVKFGHQPNASSGILTDIWELGPTQPIYIFPAVAGEVVTVKSNNIADTEPVVIIGLNAAGLEQREEVTLNGTTAVPVPGVWTAITRMFNDGSNDVVGLVTIQGDGSTTTNVFAAMEIDDQQTSQAIYTVPSDKVAVITNFSTAVNKSGGADVSCLFALKIAKPVKIFRTQIRYGLQAKGTSNISSNLIVPIPLGPGFKVRTTANSSANTTDVSAEFSMQLIDKTLVPPEVLAAILAS